MWPCIKPLVVLNCCPHRPLLQASYSFPASTVLSCWLWRRLTRARLLVTLVTEELGQEGEEEVLRDVLTGLGASVTMKKVHSAPCCLFRKDMF